jgi:hypothetical protein
MANAIRVYTSSGWQDMAYQGPPGTIPPYQIGQTWGVGGILTAGMILPQIFIPIRGNQSVRIAGLRALINTGTNVGIQLTRNGSVIGSVLTVSTTPGYQALTQALVDGDRIGLVISAPVSNPSDLSATVILEHTAA